MKTYAKIFTKLVNPRDQVAGREEEDILCVGGEGEGG